MMRNLGMAQEAEWLSEILQWPIEWSSLHGIAEIKLPLCKISTRSDSLSRKYVVRIPSERYPEGAPTGIGFPFLPPDRYRFSESRSFLRGIENPIDESLT